MIRQPLLSFLAVAALLPAIASAEDTTAAQSEVLGEVVVTAERREASVQKTPLNISVVTSEDMTRRGITDNRALLDSISGLKMNATNPNAYIGLYGLGSAGGNQYAEAVMTFNYGGVTLSRQTSAASAFYDVDRVEVLKGPQGTLYGRNATVGAINVIPTRPKDGFEAGATITGGNYNTRNASGYLNVPLGDTVSSRLAFQTSNHDGYYTNGLDDADNWGVRASLKWDPNSNLSVLVWGDAFINRADGPYSTFQYYNSSSQHWINDDPWFGLEASGSCGNQLACPSFAAPSAGGVNTFPAPGGFADASSPNSIAHYSLVGDDGYNDTDQFIVASEINYDFSGATLTVIPAYVDTKIDFLSYSNGLRFENRTDATQFSLEARLASNSEGRLHWVAGAFYFDETQDALQVQLENAGFSLFRNPNLTDETYAVFGDVSFAITDVFRLLAGARYMNERKTQDGDTTQDGLTEVQAVTIEGVGGTCTRGGTPANPIMYQGIYAMQSTFCIFPNGGAFEDDEVTWKLGAEFDLSPDSMLYATARTGYRAGGLVNGNDVTYAPEKPLTYELGLRSRYWDRRLQTNLTGFYWDYEDQQISQLRAYTVNGVPVGQTSYPANFDGNFYGFEGDVQALVTPHDRVSLNVLWTKGKYDSTPPVAASTGPVAPQFDLPRINLPEWTVNAGYNHVFEFAGGASIVPEVRAHYESSARLRIIDPVLLTPGDIRDSYTKLNATLSYNAPDDRWSITAYCNNITDEAVIGVGSSGQTSLPVFFRPSSNTTGVRSATLDPPRTYGIRLTAKF